MSISTLGFMQNFNKQESVLDLLSLGFSSTMYFGRFQVCWIFAHKKYLTSAYPIKQDKLLKLNYTSTELNQAKFVSF